MILEGMFLTAVKLCLGLGLQRTCRRVCLSVKLLVVIATATRLVMLLFRLLLVFFVVVISVVLHNEFDVNDGTILFVSVVVIIIIFVVAICHLVVFSFCYSYGPPSCPTGTFAPPSDGSSMARTFDFLFLRLLLVL
jgi:hypothetical protein